MQFTIHLENGLTIIFYEVGGQCGIWWAAKIAIASALVLAQLPFYFVRTAALNHSDGERALQAAASTLPTSAISER